MCGGTEMDTALSVWGGAIDKTALEWYLSWALKDKWTRLITQEGKTF